MEVLVSFAIMVIAISASGVMSPGTLFAANVVYGLKEGNISGLKIGKIKEGYDADLTIIDTDSEQLIDEDFFVSKSTNSPIIGMILKGKVLKTIYRGEVVYES